MPQGDKYDFGKFLAEIVAKQIPVRFVSSVTVIFKIGKQPRGARLVDVGCRWRSMVDVFV